MFGVVFEMFGATFEMFRVSFEMFGFAFEMFGIAFDIYPDTCVLDCCNVCRGPCEALAGETSKHIKMTYIRIHVFWIVAMFVEGHAGLWSERISKMLK